MKEVKAFVESKIFDEVVEHNSAFIMGSSVAIEMIDAKFNLVDSKGEPKEILTAGLKSVTYSPDARYLILSYEKTDIYFILTQTKEEWENNIFTCVAHHKN